MTPDVLVLGGGVIGLTVALRAAQTGRRVVVVDRGAPGGEASSAAAGALAPQLESLTPGPFLELCLRSRSLYPAFVQELQARTGVDVGYVPSGVLAAAFDEPTLQKVRQSIAQQKGLGLN